MGNKSKVRWGGGPIDSERGEETTQVQITWWFKNKKESRWCLKMLSSTRLWQIKVVVSGCEERERERDFGKVG